jgi:hypothetical protein
MGTGVVTLLRCYFEPDGWSLTVTFVGTEKRTDHKLKNWWNRVLK